MSIAVKVAYNGEFRRARIPSLSLEELEEVVMETFPELPRGTFDIHYRDDEGDACLLSRATFADFEYLNKEASTVKLEVVSKQSEQVPASGSSNGQPSAGQAITGVAEPFGGPPACWDDGYMDGLLACLRHDGGANLGPLLSQFVPMLVQQLSRGREKLEELAVEEPDRARKVVQVVRLGLERFPQFQATCAGLDELLSTFRFDGLGAMMEVALQTFQQLPSPVQFEVVSAVLVAAAQRGELHPSGHGSECPASSSEKKAEGTKGHCKGHGKGCKGKGWDSSSSSSSSSSASSVRAKVRKGKAVAKQAWKAEWKAQKQQFKAEWKAQKQQFKAEKRVQKQQFKAQKRALKLGLQRESAGSKDYKFPVEVEDGRSLSISWNHGDDPAQVAAEFATQHHIGSDELPCIVRFIEHAQVTVQQEQQHAQAQPMDVAEPSYDEKMAELVQMGFENQELNAELLAVHNGDVQAVLEKLL